MLVISSYFEDVTDQAGVNMDHYWSSRTKFNAGTHTFGASFTVRYKILAHLNIFPFHIERLPLYLRYRNTSWRGCWQSNKVGKIYSCSDFKCLRHIHVKVFLSVFSVKPNNPRAGGGNKIHAEHPRAGASSSFEEAEVWNSLLGRARLSNCISQFKTKFLSS